MAIILEKDQHGKPTKIKSVVFPPTKEEEKKALDFDALLQKSLPALEKEFLKNKLLSAENSSKKNQGDIKLWFSLGSRVRKVIKESGLVKQSEYIWALQAARKYLSPSLLRKDRGSRLHLDYCIRVSELPWDAIKHMKWGDWVYFLDSKSLRSEKRADAWIQQNIQKFSRLDRDHFRHLAQLINAELKDIDTSIYTDKELFAVYDTALGRASQQTMTGGGRKKSTK